MDSWHHHRRPPLALAETWFLPFNSPLSQPELEYTHPFAGSLSELYSQAPPEAINSIADTPPRVPYLVPSSTVEHSFSSCTPSNGPQYQRNQPRTIANLSESHYVARNLSVAPRTGDSAQELQEAQAYQRHNVLDWNSRYADIKKFYKDEGGDLEATRKKMLDLGFDAS